MRSLMSTTHSYQYYSEFIYYFSDCADCSMCCAVVIDMTNKYYILFFLGVLIIEDSAMAAFENISLTDFKWLNAPPKWTIKNDVLEISTGHHTDFWQETYYNFKHNTGHVFGVELKEDFTFTTCIAANFTTLYDQAGLMIYVNEKQWLKAGIEYNDGQPMIGSVNTNEISDWATGVYPGDPKKFYLRLTKLGNVVCVKYSTDNVTWILLRLAPFPKSEKYFVGPMACTPQREGLNVKFSEIKITVPADDILHAN